MTKQKLLDALATKFHRVEEPGEPIDYGGLKYYLVKVYDLNGDAIRDINIAFYVEDEGGAGEAAYWSPSEPKKTLVVDQFRIDVVDKIAQIQLAQPDFKFYDIVTIDSVDEKAIVDTYWLATGKLEKRGYGVYRKADSSIDFLELV